MEGVAGVEGTIAFAQRVVDGARERLGKGKPVVEEHYSAWADRGATPAAFMNFLRQRPWATADLAELLDCAESEAEAVLWALGFSQAESGLWRPGGDAEAQLIQEAVNDLHYSFNTNPMAFERAVQERTTELLRTGELPAEPTYDEDELPEDEDVDVALVKAHCACGRDECEVTAVVMRTFLAGDDELRARLRLVYSEPTDHFVLNLDELGALIGAMAAGA